MTAQALQSISFYTQGCRLNQSETALIEGQFEEHGIIITPFNEPADVAVINTCTVTEGGDSDARRLVNKVTRLNPDTKVALIGCMAQIQKEKLLQWPNVQWVIGNHDKSRLAEIVLEGSDESPIVMTPKMSKEPFTLNGLSIDKHHTRANLKIQDGCDFYCAFCIIPFARGPARSRQFDDIIKEATALANSGHQELVLTGINIGTYTEDGKSCLDVIKALNEIDTLKRIRISSIEPTTIPFELIDYMAKDNKLCRYLHIPIQSGCDEILTAMARKYDMKTFDEFIQYAYKTVPDICIGTDVIVGFPGETDELFDKTETFLREAPIHYFHVFRYSERTMARSKKIKEVVPDYKITDRSRKLRELSQRKKHLYMSQFIGREQQVLVESLKQGQWVGLTEHYCRVRLSEGVGGKNEFVSCEIDGIDGEFLLGS